MNKRIILTIATALVILMGCETKETKVPAAGDSATIPTFTPPNDTSTALLPEESTPQYPGGEQAMSEFLYQQISYPRTAQENGVQGTVYVKFVIDSAGNVRDVKTVGGKLGAGLEEEAIRVISAMPRWKPGELNGKKVSVEFALPVKFTLE